MRGLLMLIFRRKKLRVELALDLLALTLLVRQISLSRDCQQNIVWPAVWSVLKLAIHTAGRLLSSVVYLFIRPAVGIASVNSLTYQSKVC